MPRTKSKLTTYVSSALAAGIGRLFFSYAKIWLCGALNAFASSFCVSPSRSRKTAVVLRLCSIFVEHNPYSNPQKVTRSPQEAGENKNIAK